MSEPIHFFIPCLPPTVTAQQKGAFALPGGGIRFYKKGKVKQAEQSLCELMRPHVPREPMRGAISLSVLFCFPWRKSESKRVTREFEWHPIETRPDIDNLAKAAIDVMTTLQFWNDDGQIADLWLRKQYCDKPGIGIDIERVYGETRGEAEE